MVTPPVGQKKSTLPKKRARVSNFDLLLKLEPCAELHLENLATRRYVVIDSDLAKITLRGSLFTYLKEVWICNSAYAAQL